VRVVARRVSNERVLDTLTLQPRVHVVSQSVSWRISFKDYYLREGNTTSLWLLFVQRGRKVTDTRLRYRILRRTRRQCSIFENFKGLVEVAGRGQPFDTSGTTGRGPGATNERFQLTNHAALSSPVQPA